MSAWKTICRHFVASCSPPRPCLIWHVSIVLVCALGFQVLVHGRIHEKVFCFAGGPYIEHQARFLLPAQYTGLALTPRPSHLGVEYGLACYVG
jgi:hypothetical protein